MLKWFRRRGGAEAGPDYAHIDSREKAEELFRRGELQKLLLMPAEFGGQDIPPNVVYVPPFAAALKARIDLNTIVPMLQKGQAQLYQAAPEYEGRSFIPSLIRISAADPGHFEATVGVWGKSVQQNSAPGTGDIPQQAAKVPDSAPIDDLGPEEIVQAFIADYERWNEEANRLADQDVETGMDAADSEYAKLITKYCLPGHQHQPLSFGSDSQHDTAREAIVGVETNGNSSVVKTRHSKTMHNVSFTADYEYHLEKVGLRWFLTSILYVDIEGKYEGL